MNRTLLMLRGLAVAGLAAIATAAAAQSSPSPAPGAIVRDARGEVLGRIESVVADNAGRPVQVIVRSRNTAGVRSALRAIPAGSLRPEGDGFATPLRKAEFEVLRPVKR